jgi:hypothetical protein
MGRTVLSSRWQLDVETEELKRFRHALRKEDREILDQLMLSVRKHISAVSYAANVNMLESLLLCMLLEQEKRIRGQETLIAALIATQEKRMVAVEDELTKQKRSAQQSF